MSLLLLVYIMFIRRLVVLYRRCMLLVVYFYYFHCYFMSRTRAPFVRCSLLISFINKLLVRLLCLTVIASCDVYFSGVLSFLKADVVGRARLA